MFAAFAAGALMGAVSVKAFSYIVRRPSLHVVPPPPPPALPPPPRDNAVKRRFVVKSQSSDVAEQPSTPHQPDLRLSALKRATSKLKKTPPMLTLEQKKDAVFSSESPLLAEIRGLAKK
jgi:hypothetical protein